MGLYKFYVFRKCIYSSCNIISKVFVIARMIRYKMATNADTISLVHIPQYTCIRLSRLHIHGGRSSSYTHIVTFI